jgi:nucleoside-diphosphate-sugar epimerase
MNVLYIGGTGEISYACVHAAVALGQKVTVYNRGRNHEPLPESVRVITGDLGDHTSYARLGEEDFDVVCQFLAYDLGQIERDIEVFAGRTRQYIFISSASAYQKPQHDYRITEDTPLENPYWEYSRKKAAMERRLTEAHRDGRLPVTIVRPSHTHRRRFPGTFIGGDHIAWRMLAGKPIIVHGDSNLWTLTHSDDFAQAFVRLCGNDKALGEAFHITRDHAHLWAVVLRMMGEAIGAPEPELVHIASQTLVRYNGDWAGPLLGDKSCSVVFDNSKVSRAVGGWSCRIPLEEGLRRTSMFVRQRLDAGYAPKPEEDALVDGMIEAVRALAS